MKKALCALAVCAVASLSMSTTAIANGGHHGGGGHGGGATTCNGTFVGATFGSIVVPDNGVCILIASTVNGNVTVKKNAYFEAAATNISGSVTSFRSQTVFIHDASTVGQGINAFLTNQVYLFDSTVTNRSITVLGTSFSDGTVNSCGMNVQNGNINVLFSGSDILVGDPLTSGCAGNTVDGEVNVSANYVQVELVIRGNTISDDLEVLYNRGPAGKFVEANIGGDELVCKKNKPPFTAGGNIGWQEKKGQCAGP